MSEKIGTTPIFADGEGYSCSGSEGLLEKLSPKQPIDIFLARSGGETVLVGACIRAVDGNCGKNGPPCALFTFLQGLAINDARKHGYPSPVYIESLENLKRTIRVSEVVPIRSR